MKCHEGAPIWQYSIKVKIILHSTDSLSKVAFTKMILLFPI